MPTSGRAQPCTRPRGPCSRSSHPRASALRSALPPHHSHAFSRIADNESGASHSQSGGLARASPRPAQHRPSPMDAAPVTLARQPGAPDRCACTRPCHWHGDPHPAACARRNNGRHPGSRAGMARRKTIARRPAARRPRGAGRGMRVPRREGRQGPSRAPASRRGRRSSAPAVVCCPSIPCASSAGLAPVTTKSAGDSNATSSRGSREARGAITASARRPP
jgi:hypothetical protein